MIQWMGLLFLAIGVIVAGIGVFVWLRHRSFMRHAEVSKGEVVEYAEEVRRSSNRTMRYYFPIVRFNTPDGLLEERSKVGTSWRSHKIGLPVDVYYLRDNPARFKLKSTTSILLSVIPVGVGMVFVAIGAALSGMFV